MRKKSRVAGTKESEELHHIEEIAEKEVWLTGRLETCLELAWRKKTCHTGE